MGCDIHFYVEKKVQTKIYDIDYIAWVSADKWSVNENFLLFPKEKGVNKWIVKYNDCFYNGDRNYDLFAILANVRNEDGLIKYISLPRGLPDDVLPEIKKEAERLESDAHSHSWLLLKELIDFDWNQSYFDIFSKTTEHITETCGAFIRETIPKLQALGEPENVRIVFWFDN